MLYNALKELCQNTVVPEPRLLQLIERLLPAAVHLLRDRELHVEEISAELAGKGAAEDLAVFFQRLLFHGGEGVVQLLYDFTFFIHIAAADPVYTAVRLYEFSDLADRFFIHAFSF